jgi:hypothetical protein
MQLVTIHLPKEQSVPQEEHIAFQEKLNLLREKRAKRALS